jgi:hypothetical protein
VAGAAGAGRGSRVVRGQTLQSAPASTAGFADKREAFRRHYEIVWSIYVRCNNLQKLREVHIPALEALIGQPHGGEGWLYENENYNENRDRSLRRIIAVQGLDGPTMTGSSSIS